MRMRRNGWRKKRKSQEESDAAKKAEYQAIAKTIRKVPAQRAQSFREALQSVYFLHMCTQFDDVSNHSFGRFDQYMYPYYKQDIDAGVIKKKDAQELIDALWLKYSEWVWTISANTAD